MASLCLEMPMWTGQISADLCGKVSESNFYKHPDAVVKIKSFLNKNAMNAMP